MRLTALWWWIDRWRKSTAYTDMTLEEQGAYRNLLDEAQLRGGPIPNDERILAKSCGDALAWDRVRPAVIARFELIDGSWRNATLDSVYARSLEISTERSKAGKAGNDKRWGVAKPIANDIAKPVANGIAPSPSPSPSPDQVPTPAPSVDSKISVVRGAIGSLKSANGNGNGNHARALRPLPITPTERAEAKKRRHAKGGCMHHPRCERFAVCVDRMVMETRP